MAAGVVAGGFTMVTLIPLGIVLGALVAFIIFGRRAQKSVYRKAEGQTGAAAWALENLRGKWRVTPGVAATGHFDAVHRVIGRPGVIFVGEGSSTRVKPLLAQEKKRTARLVGDVPIYDIVVGNGEGEVPLSKLERHLTKLPANITVKQMDSLESRLAALGTKGGTAADAQGPAADAGQDARRAAHRAPALTGSPSLPSFRPNRHLGGKVRVDRAISSISTRGSGARQRRGSAGQRRTTAVLVSRSCSPRRSVSVNSGGMTSAINSPRTSARPIPTWMRLSTDTTIRPNTNWPGVKPNSRSDTAPSTNQTASTPVDRVAR